MASNIIPVNIWPRVIYLDGIQIVNASVSDCVKAGYRLIPTKPSTPVGKRIKKKTLIQDPDIPEMSKYDIIYEDISTPIQPIPEVLVTVPITNVVFMATTNGAPRGWKLKTMLPTNVVMEIE